MPFLMRDSSKPRPKPLIAPPPTAAPKVAGLYPVLRAAELLAHPKRALLLERIEQNTHLDSEYYDRLYRPLITDVVEFVQVLPYHVGGALGSLMDYSLERGALALRMYNERLGEDPDPLQAYALFSAALLQDVGKVMSQQKVMISDEQGCFIAEWLVCEGSLLDKAKFYKIRCLDQELIGLAQAVTPILARQLMPPLGFTWLWDNHHIFRAWLGMLTGSSAGGIVIAELLQLVNQQLDAELQKLALPPLAIEVTEPEQTALGEAFLAWLQQQLEAGTIVNQAAGPVHVLASGDLLLECPQIFKQFCAGYARRADYVVVSKQFNYLGFTKMSGEDLRFEQYYATYPDATVREQASKAVSRHFLAQKRQDAADSGVLQKVRQGMVIEQRFLPYLFGKNEVPAASPVQFQPVGPVLSNQQRAQQRLGQLQAGVQNKGLVVR